MLKNLTYIISWLFSFFISLNVWACPLCVGQDSRDKNYIYIISIFIVLIYIPMFWLYKTFMKYKNINNSEKI